MLPTPLLQSLDGIKGFNKKAFENIHLSGEQITSVRINSSKKHTGFVNHLPIPWCIHGFYLAERPSFTLDPTFHAGAYYVQEASSMFLWQALEQIIGSETKGLKVLDLCAAPGGKSTLLANYFKDGLVVSNEVIKARANILIENITKWGADNVVVTNNDPSHFKALENYFDVIVVDAPCSGSGLFRKDKEAINEWSENNVQLCSERQERIIANILPCLKENGILIYSTCSYSQQEDEDILDTLTSDHSLTTIQLKTDSSWGIVETESTKNNCFGYRFYPYLTQGEGLFLAALTKVKGGALGYYTEQKLTLPAKGELQIIQDFIPLPNTFSFFKQGESIKTISSEWFADLQILAKQLYIKKAGIELATIKGKDVIPHHELALSMLPILHLNRIELDKQQALQYLRRQDLFVESAKGWNLVTHCELPLGWAKVLPNRMNNYYPQAWRILKD